MYYSYSTVFIKMFNKCCNCVTSCVGFIVFVAFRIISGLSLIVIGVIGASDASTPYLYLSIIYGIVGTITNIVLVVREIRRNQTTLCRQCRILSAMNDIVLLFIESFIVFAVTIYEIKRCKELEDDDLINHCEISLGVWLANPLFLMLFQGCIWFILLSLYRRIRDGIRNQEI